MKVVTYNIRYGLGADNRCDLERTANAVRGAVEGIISTPAGALRVYSLHLSSISPRERLAQIDALLDIFASAEGNGGASLSGGAPADPVEAENYKRMDWSNGEPAATAHTLFMGDFNSVAESAEYIRFAGTTALYITHDIATVRAIADSIVVMYQGEVVETGGKAEALSPPHHDYTHLLLSSVPEMKVGWLEGVIERRRMESAGH